MMRVAVDYDDPSQANLLIVEILLGNYCNYACSYCPPEFHDNTLGYLNIDDLLRFTEAVHAHWKGWRICFRTTGGEPTVHPKFPQLLDNNRRLGIYTTVNTNGSRSVRWWEKHYRKLDMIFFSFHPERASTKHFDAIAKLIDGSIPIVIEIMSMPERFTECQAVAEFFRSQNYRNTLIVMKKMRNGFGSPEVAFADYSEDQLAVLETNVAPDIPDSWFNVYRSVHYRMDDGTTLPMHYNKLGMDWFDFRGWRCDAGLVNLAVSANGDIYRAQCRQGGQIGNVKDQTYIFPTESIMCQKSVCLCTTDQQIRKMNDYP